MLVIPEGSPRANERLVGGMFPIVSGLTCNGGGSRFPDQCLASGIPVAR